MAPRARLIYEASVWDVPGPYELIPLLLYHRTDLAGPKPAVVYYHGVVQRKEAYLDTHPMARALADAGFLVALPDAPGHGERPGAEWLKDRLRKSLPREFTLDIERSGDEAPSVLRWLAERPEVDADRLGALGVSMGGFSAAVVAAKVREQLRAAVCINGSADLPFCLAMTDSINPDGWGPLDRTIESETAERIDRVDPLGYPERFAPLPMLLLHGALDTWNPCITSRRFAAALHPFYKGAPENLRSVIVPGAPHWPPSPAMVQETVSWLTRHVMGNEQLDFSK